MAWISEKKKFSVILLSALSFIIFYSAILLRGALHRQRQSYQSAAPADHAETTTVLSIRPFIRQHMLRPVGPLRPKRSAFPAISSEPLIWLNRRGITRVGWWRGRRLQMVHSSDPCGRTADVSGPPILCGLHNTHAHTHAHKYRLIQFNLFMTDLHWEHSSVYSAVKSDLRMLNNRSRR